MNLQEKLLNLSKLESGKNFAQDLALLKQHGWEPVELFDDDTKLRLEKFYKGHSLAAIYVTGEVSVKAMAPILGSANGQTIFMSLNRDFKAKFGDIGGLKRLMDDSGIKMAIVVVPNELNWATSFLETIGYGVSSVVKAEDAVARAMKKSHGFSFVQTSFNSLERTLQFFDECLRFVYPEE